MSETPHAETTQAFTQLLVDRLGNAHRILVDRYSLGSKVSAEIADSDDEIASTLRDAAMHLRAALRQPKSGIDCPLCGVIVEQVASATLSLALWQHVNWACKSRQPRPGTCATCSRKRINDLGHVVCDYGSAANPLYNVAIAVPEVFGCIHHAPQTETP